MRRRKEDYVGVRALEMDVLGRRIRGRPRVRWKDRLNQDFRERAGGGASNEPQPDGDD